MSAHFITVFLFQSTRTQAYITVLDVNDNAPQFTADPFVFTVHENVTPGTNIARVSAMDPDLGNAGTVSYKLAGQMADAFHIREVSETLFQ